MTVSRYRKGYQVEHFCKRRLQEMGAYVIRSAGSKGLADLVGIFPENGEIWLVQVKQAHAPKNLDTLKKRFEELGKLAGTYTCRSFIFIKVENKYRFVEVSQPSKIEDKKKKKNGDDQNA